MVDHEGWVGEKDGFYQHVNSAREAKGEPVLVPCAPLCLCHDFQPYHFVLVSATEHYPFRVVAL
jgi:hypothetical protein